MPFLNPFDILMWTFRRSGRDVVKLYDSLSPVMQLATGGDMLNFGYWTEGISDPISAQQNLCRYVGEVAGLSVENKKVLDVGSGLSAPAVFWRTAHPSLDICCININFSQLASSVSLVSNAISRSQAATIEQGSTGISRLNATSTFLPIADSSVDIIIALESAQHFRPIRDFVSDSARILKPGGILVMAIPVVSTRTAASFFTLGILSVTWSSEHYTLEQIQSAILYVGLSIANVTHIGHTVYEPLADYYVQNREKLRHQIQKKYPSFVEKILYRSILKMRHLSSTDTIDYVVIKAEKK